MSPMGALAGAGCSPEYIECGCQKVIAEPVSYDRKQASDGMMVAWQGQNVRRLAKRMA